MGAKTLNEIRIKRFLRARQNPKPADAIRFFQSYNHGNERDYLKRGKQSPDEDSGTLGGPGAGGIAFPSKIKSIIIYRF